MTHTLLPAPRRASQRGMMMIEALMAVLILAVGILGLVGINSVASGAQSDAQYRGDANRLAAEMVNTILLNVDRNAAQTANVPPDASAFLHRATATDPCDGRTGTPSTNPLVQAWVAEATSGSGNVPPGATAMMQQISIINNNEVVVTVCWQGPTDAWKRKHVVTAQIY